MAIITEVQFAYEWGLLAHTLDTLRTVDISVVREASTDPEQDVYVFRFEGAESDRIRDVLEADHTVEVVHPMEGFDAELWGIVFAEETKLMAPKVTSRDGFVLEARSSSPEDDPRGWHERWLLPDRRALHEIWKTARNDGFQFEVLEFRDQAREDPEYPGPYVLTEQQRETLILAYERGYFEEPRETSLDQLASELDLSGSAVGARLRRGMESLIGMSLVAENPPESDLYE